MDIENYSIDDLDWAAGLPHATVAAMHITSVVDLVRAGWIVADPARAGRVSAAINAMDAFAMRTVVAVAGVIDVLDDADRAEFFADFAEDFPPDISIDHE